MHMQAITEEKKINKILVLIILLIIIVISDDTVFFGTNINQNFILIKYAIIIGLFVIFLFTILMKKIKLDIKTFGIILLMTVIILLSGMVNNDIRLGYIYKSGLLALSLFVVSYIPFFVFFHFYNKAMTIIAIASLAGFILAIFFNDFLSYFPIVQNSAYLEFHNLFLTVIPRYFYTGMIRRNFGIFREPAIFSTFLIIALIFQLFLLPKPKISTCIIYILSIITTFSTTGYIALLFLVTAYLIKRNNKKLATIQKVSIAILVILIFSYLFLFTDLLFTDSYISVFGKLYDINRNTTRARFASVILNIKMFLSAPFLGVGLSNLGEQFPILAQQFVGGYTTHNTNTLLIQFSSHGFFYGVLWVFGFWKLCKRICINVIDASMVFIVINVLFIGSNITFSFLTSVLLIYGYNYQVSKCKYKEEHILRDEQSKILIECVREQ